MSRLGRGRVRTGAAGMALALLCGMGVAAGPGGAGAASGSTPIVIGLICSCTGGIASSEVGGVPTYESWAKEVNAHGGINGHKIQVIEKDDGLNPGTALTDVQAMVNQDHAVAIVDASAVDSAWADFVQSAHVPVVGGNAQSLVTITNPNFFSAGETIDGFFTSYAYAAKKVNKKNIGNFYCSESAACQEALPLLRSNAQKLGLAVAYVTSISGSQPNYTAACLAAKQAGVNALLVGEAVVPDEAVAADCSKQGYFPFYIEGDGAIAKSFTTAPGLSKNFIGFEQDVPFFLTDVPGLKLMYSSLAKYAPNVPKSPNFGEQEVQMWVSGLLFQAAATAANAGKHGPVTSEDIYKGLYSLHNTTLGGMAPPLSYKEGQTNPVHCWFWVRIENHRFTAPYGIKPVCPSS